MKKIKMMILGYGQRGRIYGDYALRFPDEFEVVGVTDTNPERRATAKNLFGCPVYSGYEDMIKAGTDADLIAVATQDVDHERHAVACMAAGYDLLLEKPISNTIAGCRAICAAAEQYGAKVIVCHVLRYTPFYRKIKEIIDSGKLGEIMTVSASENVGYYHQAHSFVRGPWRNSIESSPMILAKCCHDMDILRWLIGKPCLSVASFGGLKYFKSENAPAGSAAFCSDCTAESCPYRAQKVYLRYRWMASYFCPDTADDRLLIERLRHSAYDRCVFRCDNDVVDHQVTILNFGAGVTANHSMTAFSKEIYRDIKIHGTRAELTGVMERSELEIRPFDGETETILLKNDASVGGHGGGDQGLMHEVYLALNGETAKGVTYLDVSAESHYMAFAAEQSRLAGGVPQSPVEMRQ